MSFHKFLVTSFFRVFSVFLVNVFDNVDDVLDNVFSVVDNRVFLADEPLAVANLCDLFNESINPDQRIMQMLILFDLVQLLRNCNCVGNVVSFIVERPIVVVFFKPVDVKPARLANALRLIVDNVLVNKLVNAFLVF